MRKVHPTITVLTGPQWLFDQVNGMTNKQAKLEPVIDPDGSPIIGKQVLQDPDWQHLEYVDGQLITDFLTEIPYVYFEERI